MLGNRGRAIARINSFADDPNLMYYPLTLEPEGGTWTEGFSVPTECANIQVLALPGAEDLSREGYVFQGWCAKDSSGNLIGEPITELEAGTTEPLTLYAKWEPEDLTSSGFEEETNPPSQPDTPTTGDPSTGGPAQGGGSPLVVTPIMSVYSANALTGKLTLANGKSFGLKGASLVKREGINFPTTRKVTYSSSNPKVATVSASGKVKANKKKTGKAKITIASVDNPANKKVITVTVVKKAKYKAAKKVLKTSLKASYKANAKKQVKVTVRKWSPARPSNKNFVVTASPKSRATVDPATNKVTFKKKGKVTVTVKSTSDPKAKIKVKVKVK